VANHEHLPIYKAALDAAVHFEQVAVGFSRYHNIPWVQSCARPSADPAAGRICGALISETGRLLDGVKERMPRYRFQGCPQ